MSATAARSRPIPPRPASLATEEAAHLRDRRFRRKALWVFVLFNVAVWAGIARFLL